MGTPPDDEEDRTVFIQKGAVPLPPPPPSPAPVPPMPPLGGAVPPMPARASQLPVGTVLNGIYRITRFIAKGGMGEVYEAVNIHQPDDRVAIKVMLQHLAEDELIAAMFAKEGATLTRLHHEAIVPYRLAARDPEGRPFIVTEFIPGPSLEQRLGDLRLSDSEFLALAQKLAAGLGTAHTLGAVHRDIAPDNILLVGGNPARPKIIDFGIAKDVREQSGTIVGDGFAGKPGYVAPEQLGEFGRNIGPWTDIYSLALTLRAVAAGKRSDMGGSMADAVRKRMDVPDLSDIPAPFRPAFAAALQPDPAQRPQSMAAFNLMLSGLATNGGVSPIGDDGSTQLVRPSPRKGPGLIDRLSGLIPAGPGQNRLPLLIGGGAAALILMVLVVVATSLGGSDATAPTDAPTAPVVAAAPAAPQIAPGSPEFAALVQRVSSTVPCSWLTLDDGDAGAARFSGAAAVPAEAQAQVGKALEGAGITVPTFDFSRVLSFPQSNCGVIDALREARGGAVKITTTQTTYEVRNESWVEDTGAVSPQPHAKLWLKIVNPLPRVTSLIALSDHSAPQFDGQPFQRVVTRFKGTITADGVTTLTYPWVPSKDPATGKIIPENIGVVVVSSDRALPADLQEFDAGWPDRFRKAAKANGWQVDAVWLRVEDLQPG